MVWCDVGVDVGDAGMSAGAAQISESGESEREFGLSAGAAHFGDDIFTIFYKTDELFQNLLEILYFVNT